MIDIVVTHNSKVLKLTTIVNGEFKKVETPFEFNSFPQDAEAYANKIQESILQLGHGKKVKCTLSFVIEPSEVVSKFITLPKNSESVDEKIYKEIKAKFEKGSLDDYFYSYEKIAPFVYQFIGVKKNLIEGFVDVATKLSLPLRAILPWALLLPKYVGSSNSSIFVCKVTEDPVVILSELGGVYFTDVFDSSKNTKELNKIIQELSVYKRTKPIDKLYTFNYPIPKENLGFSVHNIEIPNLTAEDTAGYEVNLLTHFMLDLVSDILDSHINLLNLLPLPVIEKSKMPVPVKAGASALVVAALIFGVFLFSKSSSENKNAQLAVVPSDTNVLSEQSANVVTETTAEPEKPVVLERKDLKIRIENGSGINGIAGKSQAYLEKLGYTIESIDTAEVSRSDTLFRFKKESFKYKDILVADTKTVYPDVASEDSLSESEEYDLLIIVGSSVELE